MPVGIIILTNVQSFLMCDKLVNENVYEHVLYFSKYLLRECDILFSFDS